MPRRSRRVQRERRPYARGDQIAFRIPRTATDEELAYVERVRGPSNRTAGLNLLFWEAVRAQTSHTIPTITLPMPAPLTDAQRAVLSQDEVLRMWGRLLYLTLSSEDMAAVSHETTGTAPAPTPASVVRLMQSIFREDL